MSALEEAREQARKALHEYQGALAAFAPTRLIHTAWFLNKTLTALLDATEPPVIQYADSATVAGLAEKIAGENAELMDRLAAKPAEDERETLEQAIGYELVSLSIRNHPEIRYGYRTAEDRDGLVDRIIASDFRKGPRPITDEMVEAAAREYHERGNGEGSFARMSGHVRTSLLFRMKCALRAAEEARR